MKNEALIEWVDDIRNASERELEIAINDIIDNYTKTYKMKTILALIGRIRNTPDKELNELYKVLSHLGVKKRKK